MLTREKRFESLLKINHRLNYIEDLDAVLDNILTEARKLTTADAGTIYLRDGVELVFVYTQNDTLFTTNLDNKSLYQKKRLPIDNKSIAGYISLNVSQGGDKDKVLNIPDVYRLSKNYPFQFNSKFDRKNYYHSKSFLTTSIDNIKGDNIGVIQLINKKGEDKLTIPFDKDDEILLSTFADSAAVHIERSQITREIILRMIKMAEMRDPKETGAHVQRVGAYSAELYEHWARENGKSEQEIKRVKGEYRLAAMLHDVGKVRISDIILKKNGLLTDAERWEMKMHTVVGAQLFDNSTSELDRLASEISLRHHENWDGSGYPGGHDLNEFKSFADSRDIKGLHEEEIPLSGRIVKITDVFDALISERCYKPSWDEEKVMAEIEKNAGIEYDPTLVDYFFEIYPTIEAIRKRYVEENS